MKKFAFQLERVLNYKQQVEDSLRSQHGQKVKQVRDKEKDIEALEDRYEDMRRRMMQTGSESVPIATLRFQGQYMDSLVHQINEEQRRLRALEEQEEELRNQVVDAKKETSSLELLKEKKKKEYSQAAAKAEEQEIEEFVSNRTNAVGLAG